MIDAVAKDGWSLTQAPHRASPHHISAVAPAPWLQVVWSSPTRKLAEGTDWPVEHHAQNVRVNGHSPKNRRKMWYGCGTSEISDLEHSPISTATTAADLRENRVFRS